MSKLKESITRELTYRPGAVGARARGFERCTSSHPCPVCGRKKLCSIGEHAVFCTRVSEGATCSGENDCGQFFVHPFDDTHPVERVSVAMPTPTVERAPVEVLDRANRAVLAQLSLHAIDRDALALRGFDDSTIDANAYRSTRSARPALVAQAVVAAVGEDSARRVPGIVWRHRREQGSERGWWHWRAPDGVLVPMRDLEDRVVALKVRRRDVLDGGARYLCVSSAKRQSSEADRSAFVDFEGPRAPSIVHVPRAACVLRETATRLVITEGELKADLSTALGNDPVVSIPGVGSWAAGVNLALEWGAREVAVALDMDARSNRFVADAVRRIVDELRRDGFTVSVWEWDSRFKGLDDYLAAQAAGATHAT